MKTRSGARSLGFVLLFVFVLLAGCGTIPNYEDANGPIFTGSYSQGDIEFDGVIHVVTWNIKYAEHVDSAIAEFSASNELAKADILLLQEMDEQGVEQMAKALAYNYVYYPASVHTYHGRNFGNAILSPWPLTDPAKLILPHYNPKNGQSRIAAKAVVTVDTLEIPAYSIHTETAWLASDLRDEQIDYLLESAGQHHTHVVVGGDFNTMTPGSVTALVERFEQAGFLWATEDVGHTMKTTGIGLTLDFIFTKGMAVLSSGKLDATEASDHLPVWAALSPR